ncbi:MAG: hypothetical protein A2445_03435 [Candidatus Jacksonbacteria bacterium RIFOXYC2_FULL_44_29]|nr:MAG: GatB/YqeY domain-containing protein [Parcubacteria group bacterium GW2011_GWC2_44_22]OGY74796.1 MAG: hypothetical protein A2240_02240 [Candidatus Jacksonbacteria bacterium RIFOXYA2_FULL_43_12]OGY77768.1 MAG: hypothetical protein A2295_03140 [Candidatus Jacksonbacteria bacterium RIFOXYB2_FULL_44_15]OGY78273.1 MAG: hypothetical protein A2445_03435 [Candidatus Jacksonbacteria bacterium RIFOXYC2_FULL_44_29]OGY78904.1 MAG: hypothetical protein A2550_05200 [Candidatus Jacksonbacteria bacteriu
MSLKSQIQAQLISTMKSKDEVRLSTLRLLISAIKNKEIAELKRNEGLGDEEVLAVIGKQIKSRRDSIEQFTKGGRKDLADKEEAELQILQEFMPAQMDESAIRKIVKQVIASGLKDMGPLMGKVMGQLKGQADGSLVKRIAEEELKPA